MTATAQGSVNGHHAPDAFGLPLPHDLDAEKWLLASMMFDQSVIEPAASVVRSTDFHSVAHGSIFRAIVGIGITGTKPDAPILHDELKRMGELEKVGGVAYLIEVVEAVSHAENAMHYAGIVRQHSLRRQAMRRGRDIMLRASDEREDPAAIVADAVETFDRMLSSNSNHDRFNVVTAPDLMAADYTQSYLVEGILVEGQPCLIGGPSKSLKTTLGIDLFVALTTGGSFLGKYRVARPCRTLFMSGESGAATIAETMQRIVDAGGYNADDLGSLHVCTSLPQLATPEDLAELSRLIKRFSIDVLAIDPIYLCMPSEGVANLFAQGEALGRISDLCVKHAVTPILLHHVKRAAATTYEPIELTDLAFAGYAEWSRQWLLVGRREKYTPGSGQHALWLTVGGSAGHNSLLAVDVCEGAYAPGVPRTYDVTVRAADDVRKDDHEQQAAAKAEKRKEKATAELEQHKKLVCRHLAKHPAGDTKRGIRDHTGIQAPLSRTIAELLGSGAIVEVQVEKNGTSYGGFALKEEEKTDA